MAFNAWKSLAGFLSNFTATVAGLVPAPGTASTTKFLRDDGTWQTPAAGGVADGDKGDITVSGSGTVWTIDPNAVSLGKMAQIATDKLLGRDTAATGNVEVIGVGGGLEFDGAGNLQRSALTGPVTLAAGASVTVIPSGSITRAMQATSSATSVAGRALSTAGPLTDIQATADDTFLRRVSAALSWGALTLGMVPDALLTYAKLQQVTATGRILGRSSAGAGVVEEIPCTAAAMTLLDDVSVAAIRTTLGLSASGIVYEIDGGGSPLTAGIKGDLPPLPVNCTITGWTLLGDQVGSCVIDVWRDTYANYPPVVGDSIAGTAKPTLSAQNKAQNLTLTGWGSTALLAGDILRFNVDSAGTLTRVTLELHVTI